MNKRTVYRVGDLVEPWMTYSDYTLGVVTGVNRYGSACNSYDIQWVGQPTQAPWGPKEMRLVSRAENKNKE